MKNMNFKEAAEYIENIPMFGPRVDGRNKSGNPNLEDVLKRLGHPERKGKAIHIAGTNGKGSTAQMVANILCAKGYKVGLFTSPHLIKINERISIQQFDLSQADETDGDTDNWLCKIDISDEDFAECCMIVKEKVDEAVRDGKLHLSYFEFLFAMAAVYYEKTRPDYIVYETGLGGRLDATNVLSPVITAITAIGLEHTKYLGDTIRDIAWEKAGIVKEGIPVVYHTGEPEADLVIEAQAELLHAKAINVAKTEYIINEFTDKTIDFSVYNRYYKYNNLILPAGGAAYQVDNALTAIEICNTLVGYEHAIDQETLQDALHLFAWPGRMERIYPNVVLDGAHNPNAIGRFVESVNRGYGDKEIKLLFAVAGDKDYEPMIARICADLPVTEVYVTALDSMRGISSEYIAGLFRMYLAKQSENRKVPVYYDDDIRSAFLRGIQSVKGTQGVLFCVGSLYLIGSLKELAAEEL